MTVTATQVQQRVDIRTATGGIEYTRLLTITESSTPPNDISGDSVQLSLGSESTPGTWRDPDVDQPGANTAGTDAGVQNERHVAMLIGDAYKPPSGTYWLYSKVGDGPEAVVRRHFRVTIAADS